MILDTMSAPAAPATVAVWNLDSYLNSAESLKSIIQVQLVP
ncbi:MAG: hypothetical protein UY96_C0017G0024 [Parcubacteria group bacterium GW2011_GWB1_56_8]|nr:MAG: hypothetical protein UY96_C0017G0024 [Parcubacteria group bacterium GW2011_GWB1_56_8]